LVLCVLGRASELFVWVVLVHFLVVDHCQLSIQAMYVMLLRES
jgi:hypothetical protein